MIFLTAVIIETRSKEVIKSMNLSKIILMIFLSEIITADNLLNPCDCGEFLGVSSVGESQNVKIDKVAIRKLLSNEAVVGKRLYLVGNFGETDILDSIILKELYTNVGLTVEFLSIFSKIKIFTKIYKKFSNFFNFLLTIFSIITILLVIFRG